MLSRKRHLSVVQDNSARPSKGLRPLNPLIWPGIIAACILAWAASLYTVVHFVVKYW